MKKTIVFLTMFLIAAFQLVAQTKTISGTVTSAEDGSPLPGVNIVVVGTSMGTITDYQGHYSIAVPANAKTLEFKFVGMKSVTRDIGDQSVIDVVMEPDVLGLDEIIITAYGTQKREAKTGSVSTVETKSLKDIPETSFDKMLSGKMAGVVISSTSGQPGSNVQVRIRGNSSILAGNQPLYVVDGVPVMQGDQSYFTNTSNALSAINPADIESITVLKDAAAAAVYGSRAANGVILITTKSGKAGESRISFRTSYGFDQLANDNHYGTMKFDDWLQYQRDAVINAGGNPDDSSNPRYYFPESYKDSTRTNWLDELTRRGPIYNAELSIEGGNTKTTHYFSGSYQKHEGVFYDIGFERFQGRLNLDHQVKKWLKVGTHINVANLNSNDVAMQSLYFVNPIFAGLLISPLDKIRNEDGSYNLNIPSWMNTNPRANAEYDEQWEKQNRINGNIYVDIDLYKGLKFRTTNNYEYMDGEGRRYWSPKADLTVTKGTLQTSRSKYGQLTTSNLLTYNNTFGVHTISATAGQEATKYNYNSYYIYSPDVDPNIPFPTTSTSDKDEADYEESEYTLLSYFGLLSYNYDNRYFLQGSVRRDGSSRFGENNKWGTFWSVGLSWNISNEAFLENSSIVNLLKLRGSYGLSGNFNIGNYEQFGLYGSYQYNGVSGFVPTQPANPDLGWETNREYNIGLDYAFFDIFTGSLDVYKRFTEDMLLNYPLSRTSGFSSIRKNIGKLSNQGFEFMIDAKVFKTSDFTWNLGFNVAYNESEILDLGKDKQFIDPDNNRIVHKVGERLHSFYLYDYAGVNPANGEALWYNDSGELTNKYSDARRIVAGSPEPKFTGGFNTLLSWKGLSLNTTLMFKTGNQVLIEEERYLNSDGAFWLRNQVNIATDYWKKPGDITRNPKPIADNATQSREYRSTRHMYDGDYLRIKDVTLSYGFSNAILDKIKLQSLRIYASAVNLYTFHNVDFFDPERGVQGTGFGIYPQTKKFMLGIELSF